jgi:hypothetical protein
LVANRYKDNTHQRLYELSFGKRPAEELYDCLKDPEQLLNLAEDPGYADIKQKLAAQLMEQLQLTGDPRVVGGAELFDQVPYLGNGPMHPSYQPPAE